MPCIINFRGTPRGLQSYPAFDNPGTIQVVSDLDVYAQKKLHAPHLLSIRATCPAHLTLVDMTIEIIPGAPTATLAHQQDHAGTCPIRQTWIPFVPLMWYYTEILCKRHLPNLGKREQRNMGTTYQHNLTLGNFAFEWQLQDCENHNFPVNYNTFGTVV